MVKPNQVKTKPSLWQLLETLRIMGSYTSSIDSVCTSIWLHLSSISKISSIYSMFSGFLHTLASLATHWRTWRPSRAPPFLRYQFPSIYQRQKVLIRRTGQEEFHACYNRDPHSATHRTLDWRDQSAGTLEIRLHQKPVHHCCSAENRPLSTSGQLPSTYWMTTVSSVPHCGGDDETAQHLLLCCPSHT